jgi:hypothetical protein
MAERKTTSRSDQVRAKRETPKNRPAAHKARSAKQPESTRNMPPVVMRGGFSSMAQPKSNRKVKPPKRRYDIALSSPGVEIRLPAIPSISLGWRLASFVLVGGLVFLLYHLWTAPLYQVQFAELQGNIYISPEAINGRLNLYNKPIFTVDPNLLEEDLRRAFPGLLKDVSVQIGLPASVFVNVEERLPVIAWLQDDKLIWVDSEGIGFEPVGENDTLIMVAASGPPPAPPVSLDELEATEASEDLENPEETPVSLEELLTPEAFMTPEMVTAIITLHEQAPEDNPLVYDPQHGLGWHDNKRGWDVYFGVDVSNVDEKLNVYQAIKAHLKQEGVSPVLISVEHIHAPFYRLEP